jgi:hypothetical protein
LPRISNPRAQSPRINPALGLTRVVFSLK